MRGLQIHSEAKIDDLSKKLDNLCQVVEKHHLANTDSLLKQSSSTSTPFLTPAVTPSTVENEDIVRPDLNDEPTLAAQAAFATDYAKHVFNHSLISQEMNRSLERLNQMLQDDGLSSADDLASKSLLPPPSATETRDIQLPPMEISISCIQKLRGKAFRLMLGRFLMLSDHQIRSH